MKTTELRIEGMSCGHCVMAVRKELGKLNGVQIDDVRIGYAQVQRDETQVAVDQLNQAVERAGYRVISVQERIN